MNAEDQGRDARLSTVAGGLFVLFYMASQWISLELHNPSPLDTFDDPPWYFIRRDAITGLSFLPFFIAYVITLIVVIRKNFRSAARTLLSVGVFAFQPVWQLLLIYLRSDNLFDPVNARTSWPTFDSYISDPWRWGWLMIGLVAILSAWLLERRRRPRTEML